MSSLTRSQRGRSTTVASLLESQSARSSPNKLSNSDLEFHKPVAPPPRPKSFHPSDVSDIVAAIPPPKRASSHISNTIFDHENPFSKGKKAAPTHPAPVDRAHSVKRRPSFIGHVKDFFKGDEDGFGFGASIHRGSLAQQMSKTFRQFTKSDDENESDYSSGTESTSSSTTRNAGLDDSDRKLLENMMSPTVAPPTTTTDSTSLAAPPTSSSSSSFAGGSAFLSDLHDKRELSVLVEEDSTPLPPIPKLDVEEFFGSEGGLSQEPVITTFLAHSTKHHDNGNPVENLAAKADECMRQLEVERNQRKKMEAAVSELRREYDEHSKTQAAAESRLEGKRVEVLANLMTLQQALDGLTEQVATLEATCESTQKRIGEEKGFIGECYTEHQEISREVDIVKHSLSLHSKMVTKFQRDLTDIQHKSSLEALIIDASMGFFTWLFTGILAIFSGLNIVLFFWVPRPRRRKQSTKHTHHEPESIARSLSLTSPELVRVPSDDGPQNFGGDGDAEDDFLKTARMGGPSILHS